MSMQIMCQIIVGRVTIEMPVELDDPISIFLPAHGGQCHRLESKRGADNSLTLTPTKRRLSQKLLDDARRLEADKAYQAHDFGSELVVDDAGWEHSNTSNTWTRRVTLENEGEKTREVTYSIWFAKDLSTVVGTSVN